MSATSHPPDDRQLSALDASFLYFEQPHQPLHVGSVTILDGPVELDALRTLLAQRLAPLPRYRQHPVRSLLDLAPPHWEDDRAFDSAFHVRHARVTAPGDTQALHATIDALFATPCDLERSPWETYLVDGLADGRVAILSKVHHCMIDGVSGAQVLEVMTDPLTDAPAIASPPRVLAEAAPSPVRFDPAAALARVRDAVGAVSELSTATSPVSPLPWNGPLSANRHIVWTSFGLDEMLALRGGAGCKVNDVVLAIITGGLRTYLQACGAAVDHLRVRTLVPVSIRTTQEHLALGNRVSAMFATLPTDLQHPLARLHAVMNETRRLKAHGQPEAMGMALALAAALPSAAGPLVASLTSRYPVVHTVCTNIPGPRGTRRLLGRTVLEIHPIVPIALEIGIGFAILSYGDSLSITATTDPGLVPHADLLPAALRAAADELHDVLGTRATPAVRPAAAPAAPTVADLMTRDVVTIAPDASLAAAWSTMQQSRIRHLPVVDARGGLVGLLTHRDLLAAAQSRVTFPDEADRMRMLSWAHVDDVMETHLSTVTSGSPAADAGARMAGHKIGCLPVVDGGRLTGLVTEHDFLRWATAHMERPTT